MSWTKLGYGLAAAGALAYAAPALATGQSGTSTSTPQPSSKVEHKSGAGKTGKAPTEAQKAPVAGPEDAAIAPLFSKSATWTNGQIPAGMMGEGSEATTSKGKASCKAILNGLWYTCDVTDTMGTGANAMTFHGHMVVGYDRAAKAYKATMIDDQGSSLATMDGTLDGKKFSLETPTEMTSMGQNFKDRLTFDFTDPAAVHFTDEHKLAGKGWQLFEEATLHPEGHRQARTPSGR